MATAEAEANKGQADEDVPSGRSPTAERSAPEGIPSLNTVNHSSLSSLDMRADPDAQATVSDYLDFTEHLPADMRRSLTLIGELDQTYVEASRNVHVLTKLWGDLPNLPADSRPSPVALRGDISRQLQRAINARLYSHAEAVRMADSVNRHAARARTIVSKLEAMLETYPTAEEQKSPVTARSPQQSRTSKVTHRADGDSRKPRRPRVPRITVPGEVLAPYELDYETDSDESVSSSDEESDGSPPPQTGSRRVNSHGRSQSATSPQPPRPRGRPAGSGVGRPRTVRWPRAGGRTSTGPDGQPIPTVSTGYMLSRLQPPPPDAVPGSPDAPWLQLTAYELAELRKRMKKNVVWAPSDTMIARELKLRGRGIEAYRLAKQRAAELGIPFQDAAPAPPPFNPLLPVGEEGGPSLVDEKNDKKVLKPEPKKLKREMLNQLAAEEAEASARKMRETVKALLGRESLERSPSVPELKVDGALRRAKKPSKGLKRKRGSEEADGEESDAGTPSVQQAKRSKGHTPVPVPLHETPIPPPQLTPGGTIIHSTTPVPVPPIESLINSSRASSSAPTNGVSVTVTTTVPTKPPAETPVPHSVTPVPPPTRETRRKTQEAKKTGPPAINTSAASAGGGGAVTPSAGGMSTRSRTGTPRTTPGPDSGTVSARPFSRGKAGSADAGLSGAGADRSRRASTARASPAATDTRPSTSGGTSTTARRGKRPAPGLVSKTSSGGNSAVGRRKAPTRKGRRAAGGSRKGAGGVVKDTAIIVTASGEHEVEVEIDDDGNVIDPDEPRYCLCNRVSFGTMIQCDNVDVSNILFPPFLQVTVSSLLDLIPFADVLRHAELQVRVVPS